MKFSTLILTTFLASALASSAFAGPGYKMISKSNKKKELELNYPQLTSQKKAAISINKAIKKSASEWIDFKDDRSVSFTSHVDSLTSRYFAFTADAYSELGAHPESFNESHVYNLKTGKELNIEKSLGMSLEGDTTDEDMKRYEAAQRAMAAILVKHIPTEMMSAPSADPHAEKEEGDCYGNDTDENIEMIAGMDMVFTIRKGKLEVTLNPAHVIAVCGFTTPVTIAEIDALLPKTSILRTWLK